MGYWDGNKKPRVGNSSLESKIENLLSSPEIDSEKLNYAALKSRPSRKLSLETEFLSVLIKLRLDLLQTDLAHRFDVSSAKVSQIFINWIKLISKQLGVLVVWPSKSQVRKTFP